MSDRWETVAESRHETASESITYAGLSGYYIWIIVGIGI
jgi:hypothetical protein